MHLRIETQDNHKSIPVQPYGKDLKMYFHFDGEPDLYIDKTLQVQISLPPEIDVIFYNNPDKVIEDDGAGTQRLHFSLEGPHHAGKAQLLKIGLSRSSDALLEGDELSINAELRGDIKDDHSIPLEAE